MLLTRSYDEGTIPSLQQREPRPSEEKWLTSGPTGVTGKQVLKFKPSPPVGRSPPGSPPGLLRASPTSTPMSIQNRNGGLWPLGPLICLLITETSWPPATRAKASWRGGGSDREGHTAGRSPRHSSLITQRCSLPGPGWAEPLSLQYTNESLCLLLDRALRSHKHTARPHHIPPPECPHQAPALGGC